VAREWASSELIDIGVHGAGPVETGRGFVPHSSDYYAAESTLAIDETVSLTASVDILKAMATGRGPGRAILALGYAGWRAGQLESEVSANVWLHCPADPELLFHCALVPEYEAGPSKNGNEQCQPVKRAA